MDIRRTSQPFLLALSVIGCCDTVRAGSPAPEPPLVEIKTVSGHPMQYYVARPDGWTRDRKWPMVVAVEAAEKEFRLNAERFAKAGQGLPFIIVTPISVSNGNAGHRDPAIYPYSEAVWDRIDKEGVCAFDEQGLARVVQEVREALSGEERVYLTGFEAGAHLVWATVFHHPETLAAAVPVAGNYRGRCVDGVAFSRSPTRATLPIRGLSADGDKAFGPAGQVFGQWREARAIALGKGFLNITEGVVLGKGHVPLPDEVLAYFASLRKASSR